MLNFQMAYNAFGHILMPFVCHLGSITADIEDAFANSLSFIYTKDGDLNLNSLCLMSLHLEV